MVNNTSQIFTDLYSSQVINMNCGEIIDELKKFPKVKPVMIMDGIVLQKQICLKTLMRYVI